MDTAPKNDSTPLQPGLREMELLVERAARCLACTATATPTGSPCYEFTPGGVEVCSELPWWNGKPILPETLHEWKEKVVSYQAVPHRIED
jgi:hypothetical protein